MSVVHFFVGGVEDTWILISDMTERRCIDHFDVTRFNYFGLSWSDSNFYTVALATELFVRFLQMNNYLIHLKKELNSTFLRFFKNWSLYEFNVRYSDKHCISN